MISKQAAEDFFEVRPLASDLRQQRGAAGGIEVERAVEQWTDCGPEILVQKRCPFVAY